MLMHLIHFIILLDCLWRSDWRNLARGSVLFSIFCLAKPNGSAVICMVVFFFHWILQFYITSPSCFPLSLGGHPFIPLHHPTYIPPLQPVWLPLPFHFTPLLSLSESEEWCWSKNDAHLFLQLRPSVHSSYSSTVFYSRFSYLQFPVSLFFSLMFAIHRRYCGKL